VPVFCLDVNDAVQILCLVEDNLIPPQRHGVPDSKSVPPHELYKGADASSFARRIPMVT
jgi:hypothetical protein